jgi:hypothetical protein
MTEPLRKKVSFINDKAKDLTDQLDSVIQMANMKSSSWLRMLEEKKAKEDEELKSLASIFDAEDDLYIAPMVSNLRGDGTILVTKTEKHFKVQDISKVPMKYLMVNEEAIKQDMKLGILDIPGIEIYETKSTKLRIK